MEIKITSVVPVQGAIIHHCMTLRGKGFGLPVKLHLTDGQQHWRDREGHPITNWQSMARAGGPRQLAHRPGAKTARPAQSGKSRVGFPMQRWIKLMNRSPRRAPFWVL
jgi:hypothetical protein